MTAMTQARALPGNHNVAKFLDKVPEKGEALWIRFRAFQKTNPELLTLNHFIASALTPNLSTLLK